MIIQSKMPNDKLLQYIYQAADEYEKLIHKSFLFIGKNRNIEYQWFECFFEKKNFMHLLGIRSRTLRADEFFDACDDFNKGIGKGIDIKDCTPSRNHNRTTVNQKVSICAEMLHIENAKYMKVGLKDKISQYVDFTYAYGSNAILGFRKQGNSSFPITLIPQSIDNYTTRNYKVIAVLQKHGKQEEFVNVYSEIKKGIIKQLISEFPEELRRKVKLSESNGSSGNTLAT